MWCDRDRRYFISKSGSLADGTVIERTRWRQYNEDDETLTRVHPDLRIGNAARTQVYTTQPKVTEEYNDGAAAIDRHNRGRQDNLEIERKLYTKDWATRCNLSIVGMETVDAWKFGEAWQKAWVNEPNLKQDEWYSELIEEMIDNTIDVLVRSPPPSVAALARAQSALPKLIKTDKKRKKRDTGTITNNSVQIRCKKDSCGNKNCTYICNLCREKELYMGFCNPDAWTGHEECTCTGFAEHIQKEHQAYANAVSDVQNRVSP